MRDEVVIGSAVEAIADPVVVGDLKDYSFVIHAGHFHNGGVPSISASGLTGGELVKLWKQIAGVWVQVYDGDGNAVQLSATNPYEAILTEGVYGLSKTSGTGIVVTVQMP